MQLTIIHSVSLRPSVSQKITFVSLDFTLRAIIRSVRRKNCIIISWLTLGRKQRDGAVCQVA